MTKTSDIVVVGGGVNGTSIAMHLSKTHSGNVTLVEKGGLATGATGRSGAMIREHYLTPELVRIASRSKTFFENWPEMHGYDLKFKKTGRILLFGKIDANAARLNGEMNRGEGVSIETLGMEETSEMLPEANLEDIEVALYEPDAGYADPVATTYAFAQEAKKHGATILTNTHVSEIISNRHRVTGVRTNKGKIDAGTVVNVTGPWANSLLSQLGETLPLNPIRVQMVHLRRPPSLEGLEQIVIDHTCGAYYRTDGSPNTLIGGEAPEDISETTNPDHFGLNADHDFIVRYWERAIKRFPEFQNAVCRGGYGSLYDMTPDGNPIIDASEAIENLYNVTGFSGHGFKLSPAVGELVSELVNGPRNRVDELNLFKASRFGTTNEIVPKHPYGMRAHQ